MPQQTEKYENGVKAGIDAHNPRVLANATTQGSVAKEARMVCRLSFPSLRVAVQALGLVLATTLSGILPATAQEANQINLNGAVRSDWNGGTLTYLHAFSGDLRKNSVLLRLGAGTGDAWEDGESRMRVNVLLGYQAFVGDWRLRGFAGPSYSSRDGNDQTGLLILGQASNNRRNPVYIGSSASYETALERWSARVEVGGHLGDLIIGPEFGLSGDGNMHRTSLGAFVTGAKLGDVSLTFRTGYSKRSDTSEESPYFGISATLQF